jgi:hypothetical protein
MGPVYFWLDNCTQYHSGGHYNWVPVWWFWAPANGNPRFLPSVSSPRSCGSRCHDIAEKDGITPLLPKLAGMYYEVANGLFNSLGAIEHFATS